MDIQELAKKAAEKFGIDQYQGKIEKGTPLGKLAVYGFFKGVASGTITIGQSWPIQFLTSHEVVDSWNGFNLLPDIFASGMLCDGQALNTAKTKTFAKSVAR